MQYESADIRAWACTMGWPALLIAAATPPLLVLDSLLPPNMIWLCYLVLVVVASVRWGFAGAVAAATVGGLAGDFFFTQPYYSLLMDDPRDVIALALFLLAGLGSALLITNWRQQARAGLDPALAIHRLLLELAECVTSDDVIAEFDRWVSVTARGRATFVDAQPVPSETGSLPEEIQRLAAAMCAQPSDEMRVVATAGNGCCFLRQLRRDNVIRGTLAVVADIDVCDRKLVEAAMVRAASRYAELARQESLATTASYVSDIKFSNQWRTSLTTILGASDVLLMRRKNHNGNRVERNLLADIRDEAAHLGQLLADATSASGASVSKPRSRPHC
jgi:K+-sensing histidine kinase KdpD